MSFLLTAIPFVVLYFLKISLWAYYVPCSLIIALLWLRLIFSRYYSIGCALVNKHPEILQDKVNEDMFLASPSIFLPSLELITAFSRLDFSGAIGWSLIISLTYGIVSLIRMDWITLVLCILIAIDSAYGNMSDAFETSNEDHNTSRVIHRYIKSKKRKMKETTDMELMQLAQRYVQIRGSLLNSAVRQRKK